MAHCRSRPAAFASDSGNYILSVAMDTITRAPSSTREELAPKGKERGPPCSEFGAVQSWTTEQVRSHCYGGTKRSWRRMRGARAPAGVQQEALDGDAERELLIV